MIDLLIELRSVLASHSPRKKYLIGVSGGCDSMVLLFGLHELGYRNLVVCHFNHGLRRRDAESDSLLVSRVAAKFNYPVEFGKADVRTYAAKKKLSIETSARQTRYIFFKACAKAQRCRRIFLGHHADDQVETCLFNFFRGAGAAGLAGMKPLSHAHGLEIVRPMLGLTRKEITTFAAEHHISYCEDVTNTDLTYTRNRIRNRVIPAIEEAVGAPFRGAVLRTAEILREEESWMASLVPEVESTLDCKTLLKMPPALRRRVVLRWLRHANVPEPGFAETTRVLSLLEIQKGPAKVNLPGNRHARRRQGKLFLEKSDGKEPS